MHTSNSPLFGAASLAAFLFCFLICKQPALAQPEANIWYFGYMAGLDFSSGPPVIQGDGAIDAYEGCASYCDAQGNLLFYTNGGGASPALMQSNGARTGYIWNRNHEVMYDLGDDEGGGYSAAQSALILPVIGSDHEYYLFTMDQQASLNIPGENRGLSYFIIDMDLNGGLGGVSLANQPIHRPAVECLTVVRHENGTDYWLVAVDSDTKDFLIVPVTAAGVQAPFLQPRQSNNDVPLVLKASPDGQYLFGDAELYRFNQADGTVSFLTGLGEASFYSFSFSPSGRYLYTPTGFFGDSLLRYDVTAPDVESTRQAVAGLGLSIIGGMQLGPDGNLYMIYQGENQTQFDRVGISVVECPDADEPVYREAIFEFGTEPGIGSFFGLPNFPDFIFLPQTDMASDTVEICPGDTAALQSAFSGAAYLWSTGATSGSILATAPGTFSLTVTDACGQPSAIQQFLVKLKTANPTEAPDVTISKCAGTDTLLQAPPGADAYLWSDGNTSTALLATQPGTYSVTATDACSAVVQTFIVDDKPQPAVQIQFNAQPTPCLGDTLRLQAIAFNTNSLLWSSGDTTATIRAAAGGSYSVVARNECGEASANIEVPAGECCSVYIPNVFSPNGDGINDSFVPFFGGCEVLSYRLKVFSRWGAVVFETNDPDLGWDGTFRGKALPPDVFAFVLQYTVGATSGSTEEIRAGDVLIVQ